MRKLLPAISLLLLLGACQKEEPDQGTLIQIEKEFEVSLWEQLSTDGRDFQIIIESTETKECLNYRVDYALNVFTENYIITLKSIVEPSDCLPGIAPAKAKISLGQPSDNFYNLDLNLGESINNKGRLTVSNDKYSLKLYTLNGLEQGNFDLWKIPENLVWGYATFNDEAYRQVALDFEAELKSITEEVQLNQGYYGYFEIDSDQAANVFAQDKKSKSVNFIRKINTSISELNKLANKYRLLSDPEKIKFHLGISTGQIF